MRAFGLLIVSVVHLVRKDGLNPQSAPASGETVIAEQPYKIQWSANTPGPVRIELHYGDTSYVNITETTDNDGQYEWTPSAVFAGKDDFFLAICDLEIEHECTYTFDGRFAIVADGPILTSSLLLTSSATSTTTSAIVPSGSLSSFTTPADVTSTTTSIPNSSTSPTTSPSATSTSISSSNGLSTGATIGLSVTLSVVGTALLMGLTLFIWNRKKRRNSGPEQGMETTEHIMYIGGGSETGERAELDGRGKKRRAELEGNSGYVVDDRVRRVHELPE